MVGETVHVVGAGISGSAAALLEKSLGSEVFVSDDKDRTAVYEVALLLEKHGIRVFTGGHDEAVKINADRVVVSPGVPLKSPVIKQRRSQNIPVIGELELGYRHSKGRISAITATNGKTTTTAFQGEMFRRSGKPSFIAGNIGTPMSKIALETTEDALLSVEVSSFQLDTIVTFKPHVGILLNLTPDHIYHHGGYENYKRAKARLWMNQTSDDFLVYNADDQEVIELCESARSRKVPFSCDGPLEEGAYFDKGIMHFRLRGIVEELQIERSQLSLPGLHNVYNTLAAVTGALLIGVPKEAVMQAVKGFKGLPHRLETVRELNGVLYINDSKCTSVDSGRCALEAQKRPVILIAGGRAKGGGFKSLRKLVEEKVRRLVLIGESAREIDADLGGSTPVSFAEDMEDAVGKASRIAADGDVVLLSPLTASFDMFKDYIHRGETFRRIVMEQEA